VSRDDVVICSNRGPVRFRHAPSGGYCWERNGPNGLIPVLLPALAGRTARWLFSAQSAADVEIAESTPEGIRQTLVRPRDAAGAVSLPRDAAGAAPSPVHLQPVALPETLNREFYEVFSVGVLAGVFHRLFDPPRAPILDRGAERAWESYQAVNDLFAAALAATPSAAAPVLVHDYHLLLLARSLRRAMPGPLPALGYFHHVAWCDPDQFGLLPRSVRTALLGALVDFDAVGFHSRRWAEAFLRCCEAHLDDATCSDSQVKYRDRCTRVVVAPAAIDPRDLAVDAAGPGYRRWQRELRERAAGRWTLARVERADLWKNPLRGLLAIEDFLTSTPQAVDRTWFPAVLTPTRTWRPDYAAYLEECRAVAARINDRFAGHRPEPVTLFIGDEGAPADRGLVLALLELADALLVNPLYDGLNITPKELALASPGHPVVILSENAGIAEELLDCALMVNPYDVRETARAIGRAFTMPAAERRARADRLRACTAARTPRRWLEDLLAPLRP